MASKIDVVPGVSERVKISMHLESYGADVNVELGTADARIFAARLVAAADEADRPRTLADLIRELR